MSQLIIDPPRIVQEVEPLTVGPWPVGAAEYHADRQTVSSGMIQAFLGPVPDYAERYEYHTKPPKPPSTDMEIGTALHFNVLEPAAFLENVVRLEVDDFRSKAAQAQRNELRAVHKIGLARDDYDLVLRMGDAIRAHKRAGPLLASPGPVEYAFRWQDETGLWCRALADKPTPEALLNLKTTRRGVGPEDFSLDIRDFGYHCSAAHYIDGARQALGMKEPDELFIVVSKSTQEVACHWIDPEALELGRRINRQALVEIADRRRTGDWSSRHDNRPSYVTNLPRYAFPQE